MEVGVEVLLLARMVAEGELGGWLEDGKLLLNVIGFVPGCASGCYTSRNHREVVHLGAHKHDGERIGKAENHLDERSMGP